MNVRNKFAKRLKRRAVALGLSDAAVARRAGVESRTYGTYASGRSEPKFDCLLRICDALETHPNFLLGLTDNPERPGGQRADRLSELEEHVRRLDQAISEIRKMI